MERLLFVRAAGDYREAVGMRAGSHAWPFSQALAAHIAVKSIDPRATGVAVRARLKQLERFDTGSTFSAWPKGDVYLDDNEWLAEDLLDWNAISHDHTALVRARRIFDAVVDAWDSSAAHPCAGGVRWTTAKSNHDRNTVSTANGALVGLRLYRVTGDRRDLTWSKTMLSWLERCMRSSDGLYWDHIDLDGNVDRAEWSYNQGSMLGAYLELYRATGDTSALQRAEAIGDAALQHFAPRWQNGEPPEFAALFFATCCSSRRSRAAPTTPTPPSRTATTRGARTRSCNRALPLRRPDAPTRSGSARAAVRRARYSRPLSAARRSIGTRATASRKIERLIFDWPWTRSMKRIGTSSTRKPVRSVRIGRLDLEGIALRLDRVEIDRLEHDPAVALEAPREIPDTHAEDESREERAAPRDNAAPRPQFSVSPPGT